MKRAFPCYLAAFAILSVGYAAYAGDMASEKDFAKEVGLLKTLFAKYPPNSKAIFFEPRGLRFLLSSSSKDPVQTGLSSYFGLIGDFEVSAEFEWTPVVLPKAGYGVSCGIRVEADTMSASLARGNFPNKQSGFALTIGTRSEGKMKYDTVQKKSTAKKGQLVLRREKKSLIFLASTGAGELEELDRKEFTDATIQKVQLFGDPGESATEMNARLMQIKVRADALTTDPIRETPQQWGWWLAAAAVIVLGAIGGLIYWRRRRE